MPRAAKKTPRAEAGAPGNGARRVGRPPRLDRDMIARAAAEVGLDRITMRSVAERLGVSVPGLYHHVRGRAEMVRLAAEYSAARMRVPEDRGQHWAEWLLEWGEHARRGFAAEPELLEQFLHGSVGFDRMFDNVDAAIGLLVRQGFTAAEAAQAYQLVSQCAIGAAVAQIREAEAAAAGNPLASEFYRVLSQRAADELTNLRRLAAGDVVGTSFRDQACTVLAGIAARRGDPWQPVVERIQHEDGPAASSPPAFLHS